VYWHILGRVHVGLTDLLYQRHGKPDGHLEFLRVQALDKGSSGEIVVETIERCRMADVQAVDEVAERMRPEVGEMYKICHEGCA